MSPGHLFSRWLSLASSQQWRFRHIAERTCYERKAARHTVEPLSWPPRASRFQRHDVPSSLNEGPLSTCFDRKRTGR